MIPGLSILDAPPSQSTLALSAQATVPAAVRAQYQSPLVMTPKQSDAFDTDNLMRIFELQREMGLTVQNEVQPGSWMWLRMCNEAYFQGDLSWRVAFGGIFTKSNITLGSGLRHVRYNASKAQDDLVGTEPFFAALAQKQSKEELAKAVDAYIQQQVSRSNVRASIREAQKIAIYRNECVVKTGYISDTTPYIGKATVLVDAQNRQPIVTPNKQLYVYQDDQVIQSPDIPNAALLEGDPSFVMMQGPQPGTVLIPPTPDNPRGTIGIYQDFESLPQVMINRQGVYADPVDYRSFLCPLRYKSIHDADTCVHLYLDTPKRLNKVYGGIDVSEQYFAWWDQPGQDKPKYAMGENNLIPTNIAQQIIVAEVYRRCDPDETGEEKEVLAVYDYTNRKRIYHNYLANHMEKRPFDVVPGLERIPGRWYGRGVYGMLTSHLFYEDVELSRSFFKNSKDATIQFAFQDAVEEWKNGIAPVIGSADTYWIRPGWNAEGKPIKPIWTENLAENIEHDVELMNTMRQSADSLVGSISTASANESDFNQSKTATGNQLVQQASDVITRAMEQEHTEAINAILGNVVDIILEHMDPVEMAADLSTGILATVNRNEARSLSRDVRLLLTRSKSTQLLNTSTQAIQIGMQYRQLMMTDPMGAKQLRPLFINQLKALETQDADAICPDITDEQIAQFQASQGQQQQQPPSESISIKLPDLVGSERVQALAKFGITADQAAFQQQQAQDQQQAQQAAQAKLHALPPPA